MSGVGVVGSSLRQPMVVSILDIVILSINHVLVLFCVLTGEYLEPFYLQLEFGKHNIEVHVHTHASSQYSVVIQ